LMPQMDAVIRSNREDAPAVRVAQVAESANQLHASGHP
jgi:hypothetical protein